MNGSSGHFHASCKSRLMNLKSIKSGSAKRRDKGRMDIDDAFPVSLYHFFRQNHQKPCKDDQIRGKAVYLLQKSVIEIGRAHV